MPETRPSPDRTAPLKLVVLDEADLTVLATHLQDAVVRVRDMAFVPRGRRFALVLNRFDWSRTLTDQAPAPGNGHHERRRCAARFEHVRSARITGFTQRDKRQVLSLLTITFERAKDGEPDGFITLLFAGGGAVRLDVECIEAELHDLGAGWRAIAKPEHPDT